MLLNEQLQNVRNVVMLYRSSICFPISHRFLNKKYKSCHNCFLADLPLFHLHKILCTENKCDEHLMLTKSHICCYC